MRTNIEIDEKAMKEVMDFMGTKTKKETVNRLVQEKLQLKQQAQMRKWRGKIEWQGDLDAWRRG